MYPSYASSTKAVLQDREYPQLIRGDDQTGRSVLFRIDGQHVTTARIRNTIAANGRQRGFAWNVSIEKLDTSPIGVDEGGDLASSTYDEGVELRNQRHVLPR